MQSFGCFVLLSIKRFHIIKQSAKFQSRQWPFKSSFIATLHYTNNFTKWPTNTSWCKFSQCAYQQIITLHLLITLFYCLIHRPTHIYKRRCRHITSNNTILTSIRSLNNINCTENWPIDKQICKFSFVVYLAQYINRFISRRKKIKR